MKMKVTSRDVVARFEDIQDTVAIGSPIARHPFLSVALAFGVGCAVAQAAARHVNKGEQRSPLITERILELLIPSLLEKALREVD